MLREETLVHALVIMIVSQEADWIKNQEFHQSIKDVLERRRRNLEGAGSG